MRITKVRKDRYGLLIDASEYEAYLIRISQELPPGFRKACLPFDENFGLNSHRTRHDGTISALEITLDHSALLSITTKFGAALSFKYINVSRLIFKGSPPPPSLHDTIIFDEIRKSPKPGLWIHHVETFASRIIVEAEDCLFHLEENMHGGLP